MRGRPCRRLTVRRWNVGFPASWQLCARSIAGNGHLCGDDPSEENSCVSKQIAFVLLKYLIRSILHSRKYVCVGFLRSHKLLMTEALS